MPSKSQSFTNHSRFSTLYHFIASPISWLYFAYTFYQLGKSPSLETAVATIYAFAIACAILSTRIFAITLQNRLIRLEMRLRLREILSAALHPRIKDLTVRQLIGLRFASDAELPGLVDRTLKGEFPNTKEIKRAVTDWQPDYIRV